MNRVGVRNVAWMMMLILSLGGGQASGKRAAWLQRIPLSQGWCIRAAAECPDGGERVSLAGFECGQWLKTSVPTTVMGALVRAGKYPDPFLGLNFQDISKAPFQGAWWYRCEFELPEGASLPFGELTADGINYRAEVWLNGKPVASQEDCAGAFRRFSWDVSSLLKPGRNALAFLVSPPRRGDFTIGFVDWNPRAPDANMGLWRGVSLNLSGPVTLRMPAVRSRVDPATQAADLTVSARLCNHGQSTRAVEVEGEIGSIRFSQPLTLEPGQSLEVVFSPERFPQLRIKRPRLWWPHEMGEPFLYDLGMRVRLAGEAEPSDAGSLRFGIREVADYVTPEGHRGYKVNGRPVLIRGGGWVDDIFLAEDEAKLDAQLRYCRHLGLNTIRLEGFWGAGQRLYDLADRYGILLMAGWSCQWEWEDYLGKPVDENYGGVTSPEDMNLVADYWRDQVLWLRHHPSIFVWVLGSDLLPSPEMERRYRRILQEIDPDRPVLASCKSHTSPVSGPTAVKMTGPYEYVPPAYWYLDRENGGAFGFNTETGPGAQPPVLESLKKMIPPDHLWPIDQYWNFHCARNEFANLDHYLQALEARYGKPSGVEEFAREAQAANYEAVRAMFEAFTVNRGLATGVIQWMYNSAWPKLFWQLYDYYLAPTGAFYGTRKATRPIQAVYHYGDRGVYAVNGTTAALRGLTLRARLLDGRGALLLDRSFPLATAAGSSEKLFTLPSWSDWETVYFLDLRVRNGAGGEVVNNFYWLSAAEDVLDFAATTWFWTPTRAFADFRPLKKLPRARPEVRYRLAREGGEAVARVSIRNPSRGVLFFLELQILDEHRGDLILPVFWDDNFISLLPGESRTLHARLPLPVGGAGTPSLRVSGWNMEELRLQPGNNRR